MQIFGIISATLFALCFIPQIVAILKTKNVSGISVGLWIILIGGYITGLIYVIGLKEVILIISYSVGLVLALWSLGLIVYYKIKKR